MNRKGQTGEQLMGVVFILFLVIIGGSLAYGIAGFFGAEYDFREVDAVLLNERVKECLSEIGGNFERDTFFEKCGIDENVVSDEMLVIVSINGEERVRVGRGDETACGLGEKNKQFIKCVASSFNVGANAFGVVTGSNQESKEGIVGGSMGSGGEFGGSGGGAGF